MRSHADCSESGVHVFNGLKSGVVIMAWCVTTWGGVIQADGSVIDTNDRWGVPRQQARETAVPQQREQGAETTDPRTGLVFTVAGTPNGGVEIGASGRGLDVRKTVGREGRYTLVVRAADDLLRVEGTPSSVVLSRGDRSVAVSAAERDRAAFERAATLLAGSPALALFRSAVTRLAPETRETVGGMALEIADVLLRVIQDDPSAVERFREGVLGRQAAVMRVAFVRRPCYGDWEREVLAAWGSYEGCYNDFSWWSGGREGCALLYTLRVESAWLEFLACLSIRIV
jgi:hypothetical protein